MSTHSPYEQLKDDFVYLGLDAAAECFATLAEEAMAESWPPVVYLERVIAAQAASTRNRRLAARLRFAHFPGRRTLEEFDFSFQPTIDRKLVNDLAIVRSCSSDNPVMVDTAPSFHRGVSKSPGFTAFTLIRRPFLRPRLTWTA